MYQVLWCCAGRLIRSSFRQRWPASFADMLQQRAFLAVKPSAACSRTSVSSVLWVPVPHALEQGSHLCFASAVEAPSTQSPAADNTSDGLRFVWDNPSRRVSMRPWHRWQRERAAKAGVQPQVDIMVEGRPLQGSMTQ
jgi:hypothetical protein